VPASAAVDIEDFERAARPDLRVHLHYTDTSHNIEPTFGGFIGAIMFHSLIDGEEYLNSDLDSWEMCR
jgi:hypothetical protein